MSLPGGVPYRLAMRLILPVFAALLIASACSAQETAPFEGKKSAFQGFDCYDFKRGGVGCKVVVPKEVADGKPWIWRARFFGHQPQLKS